MLRFPFAVVVVVMFALPCPAAEPPKVADLVRRLETGSPGERVIAAEQLGDLGPAAADAFPALLKAARSCKADGDAETQRANRFLFGACLGALTAVGGGEKAVPAFVELLDAGAPPVPLLQVLRSHGKAAASAVPAVAKCLKDPAARNAAAELLEGLGPAAEPAVPALVAYLTDPKETDPKDVTGWGCLPLNIPTPVLASRALRNIGPKAEPAVREKVIPVLLDELRSATNREGMSAAERLHILGEVGRSAVPALVELIKRKELAATFHGQEEVGRALLGLGADGRKAFGELLAGPDRDIRRALLGVLTWGASMWSPPWPDTSPFTPTLLGLLRDEEPQYRLEAAVALTHLGQKAPQSVVDAVAGLHRDPVILKAAKEGNAYLFSAYPSSFLVFGEPGLRALLPLLDSESTEVRAGAVRELKWAGQPVPQALATLRRLTADPDPRVAKDAAWVAARTSLDPADTAPLFSRRLLHHREPEAERWTFEHTRSLMPLTAGSLDKLIPMLNDADEQVVKAAAQVLHDHSPPGSAGAKAVADWVYDGNHGGVVRKAQLPPAPPPPDVPALVKQLGTAEDFTRMNAAFALADIGLKARAAGPALRERLTDPDPNLRVAVAFALTRIEEDPAAFRPVLAAADRHRGSMALTFVFERSAPTHPELLPLAVRWLEDTARSQSTDGSRHIPWQGLPTGLAKYGPKAAVAVPVLRVLLRGNTTPRQDWWAYTPSKELCDLAGAIGPAARDAIPELRAVVERSRDVAVAVAARDAIRRIEGGK